MPPVAARTWDSICGGSDTLARGGGTLRCGRPDLPAPLPRVPTLALHRNTARGGGVALNNMPSDEPPMCMRDADVFTLGIPPTTFEHT